MSYYNPKWDDEMDTLIVFGAFAIGVLLLIATVTGGLQHGI